MRSNMARTPLTLVRISHWYSATSLSDSSMDLKERGGRISMNGISMTSAPRARRPSESAPAWSRARETRMRQPASGALDPLFSYSLIVIFAHRHSARHAPAGVTGGVFGVHILQNLVSAAAENEVAEALAELDRIGAAADFAQQFAAVGTGADGGEGDLPLSTTA